MRKVRIGVTGHRSLGNSDEVAYQVDLALGEIQQHFDSSDFEVISPLAEGTDRLVVERTLCFPQATLRAVLPLAVEDYLTDFITSDSRQHFNRLLSRARGIVHLPDSASRALAYLHAGNYVLEQCDVLIAVWDGKAARGKGGTAEVVAHARERGLPLAWIHTHEPNHASGVPNSNTLPEPQITYENFPKQI
jgi:hypothetical protein